MHSIKLIIIMLLLASCNTGKPTTITLQGIQMNTIPGLTAKDIYSFYSEDNFSTETDIGPELSVWSSIKPLGSHDLLITSTGKSNSQLVAIDAYFKNFSKKHMDDSVRQFIGDAAAIPYTNSKPLVAKQWAIGHSRSGGDTTIGYVSFRLTNFGDSLHVLKMSVGQWR